MANRAEVGVAYVRLLPSMQGFTAVAAKGLKESLESAGEEAGEEGGDAAGGGFMSKLKDKLSSAAGVAGKILGKTIKYAGFAGAAVSGLIAKAGVTRLVGLENANQQMKQMGLNAGDISGLMTGLLKTLKGTPYALNDGAGAMAAMVSAGAPLKRVNKYMDLIADSAAFSQKPLEEVARVFQKIQSQGKIQGDEVMSLSEMGLPAFQILAKGTGQSVDDLREKMKKGNITAEQFFDGWEKGSKGFGATGIRIEGAAQSAGDTTEGALANMRAAFGRLGAMILGTPFSNTKKFFNGVTGMVDNATLALKPFVDKFNTWFGEFKTNKVEPVVVDVVANTKDFVTGIDWVGIGTTIKAKAEEIGTPLIDGLKQGITKGDFKPLGTAIGDGVGESLEGVTTGGLNVGTKVSEMFANVDWWQAGIEVGKQAIGFVLGFAVGLLAKTDWGAIGKKVWENRGAVIAAALFVLPIGKVIGLAGKALGKIPFVGKLLGGVVTGIGKGFTKLFTPLNKVIVGGAKAAGRGIAAGFTQVFPQVASKVGGFFAKLAINAKSRLAGLLITFKTGISKIPGIVGGFIEKVARKGTALVGGLVKEIGKGAGKAFNKARAIPKKVLLAFAGAGTLLVSAGADVAKGFLRGVRDGAVGLPGLVKDKLVGAGKKILTGVTGWKINSPSKVTEKYGEFVAYGFARGLRNGAQDTKDALHELIEKLKADGNKKLLKLVKGLQSKLVLKLNQRDANLEALDKANDKLEKIKDTAKGFTDTIKSNFRALASVSNIEVNNFAEMVSTLKVAKARADGFATVMGKLQKAGLSKNALDDLWAAGPEALEKAQMILASGKAGIKQVSTLVDGIFGTGNKAATTGYNYFYKAGVDSAQGLVDGLKAKDSKLDEAIKELSNKLVSTLKKQLGIKSPSRVFRFLGRFVPAGFAQGIVQGTPGVSTAVTRMVATPALAKVPASSLPMLPAQLPMGVGYGGGGGRSAVQEMNVLISADGLNRKLMEWLREAVKAEGGNVQQVLGSGKQNR
jgi:tape measure domain-containing protein